MEESPGRYSRSARKAPATIRCSCERAARKPPASLVTSKRLEGRTVQADAVSTADPLSVQAPASRIIVHIIVGPPSLLAGVLAVVFGTSCLLAQERPSIVASAGVAPYDLSGTGTAGIYGLSVALPLPSVFLAEGGVRYLHYSSQFGRSYDYLMPEVSLQVEPGLRSPVRPYLGVGAGPVIELNASGYTSLTLHAAAGARIRVGESWLLRPEARLRSVDPWHGSDVELTVGVGRFF